MARQTKGVSLSESAKGLSLDDKPSKAQFWLRTNKSKKPIPVLPVPRGEDSNPFLSPFDGDDVDDDCYSAEVTPAINQSQPSLSPRLAPNTFPRSEAPSNGALSADMRDCPVETAGSRKRKAERDMSPDSTGYKRKKAAHSLGKVEEQISDEWLAYSGRGGLEVGPEYRRRAAEALVHKVRENELKRVSVAATSKTSFGTADEVPLHKSPCEFLNYMASIYSTKEPAISKRLSTAARYIAADPDDLETYVHSVRESLTAYGAEIQKNTTHALALESALRGHGGDAELAHEMTKRVKRRIDIFENGMRILGLR